ncbi:phosphotransferase [Flagellimonas meridianipacifica]|uniref:5-methylthioribose kinase n=1 Tax=Flagellimonas meridianipacifica TaxID=1080225 RepID=A0A2T0MFQ6_9FLAO|nr:phosphotransferase [Allomuricauda pacifica]PRX56395.1 5-methylthioribose kinase [Allomuricauda pacifica]
MKYIEEHLALHKLQEFLKANGWLIADEHIQSLQKAGEGNMNVVLRVQTNHRSFILKQSRPYVQKYPQIEAPLERIAVERHFYKALEGSSIATSFPKVIAYDAGQYLMMQEDLGQCDDMGYLYGQRKVSSQQIRKLVQLAGTIHSVGKLDTFPQNRQLRELNHQHIFILPFLKENGFSLNAVQEGLQELSLPFKTDDLLKKKVTEIGEIYLSQGTCLIHGDYYPGSWLSQEDSIYIIDPEFSFIGFPEFDLGIMAAHLTMATSNFLVVEEVLKVYKGAHDPILVRQVAGVEILRRLIGLAQLPMQRTLNEKTHLLQEARNMVLSDKTL